LRFWVGITDGGWFEHLRHRNLDEVNFWQPSAAPLTSVLGPGIPFLFKLRAPRNFIVGGGFFVRFTALPVRTVWETFGEGNGAASYAEFSARLLALGGSAGRSDRMIACNVLIQPFFFEEPDWITVPDDWHPNVQRGKTYDSEQRPGAKLWLDVRERLARTTASSELLISDEARGTRTYLAQARVGQGAFRCLVTDAYDRKCGVSGERTLPVLDAAHIKPYRRKGPNLTANGLLLRKDIHKLFDDGYMTIDERFRVVVSRRIREEFENGRDYYQYEGRPLRATVALDDQPSEEFLSWHREHVYEKWGATE